VVGPKDCPREGYGFKLGDFPFDLSNVMMNLFGFGELDLPPGHPGDASLQLASAWRRSAHADGCPDGQGMIIDIDHMFRAWRSTRH